MKKPKRWKHYKCPHEKISFEISNKANKKGKTVHGRFCKNNCDKYKKQSCNLFK